MLEFRRAGSIDQAPPPIYLSLRKSCAIRANENPGGSRRQKIGGGGSTGPNAERNSPARHSRTTDKARCPADRNRGHCGLRPSPLQTTCGSTSSEFLSAQTVALVVLPPG